MRRIKNLLVGLVLCLLAILIDRSLDAPKEVHMSTRKPFMFWINAALFILLASMMVCLHGCATARGYPMERNNKTLLVVNNSIDQYAIYAYGQRIGTAMAGKKVCLYLPSTSERFVLTARPLGGAQARYTPDITTDQSWTWNIDMTSTRDGISTDVYPTPPCK